MVTPLTPIADRAKKTWTQVVAWAVVAKATPNWLVVAIAVAGFLLGRLV